MIPEASVVSVVLDASGLGLLRKKPPSQGSSKTAHFFSFHDRDLLVFLFLQKHTWPIG